MSTQIPEKVQKEISAFGETIKEYRAGQWEAMKFKGHRTLHGVYGQRQADAHMLRVKVPGGALNTTQLKGLGEIAKRFSNGYGHITTRQNFQFYFMNLEDSTEAFKVLETHELTSREACGNAVRNICASPLAGIFPGEPFNVQPYAIAAYKHLLRHPDFQHLPRKFKINFGGVENDGAQTSMNCIGAIAKIKDGVKGFKVVVGGGLGAVAHEPKLFKEFIPTDQLLPYIESILYHFNEHGNRKNRAMARLKYLVAKEGIETFRENIEKIFQQRSIKSIPMEVTEEETPDTATVKGGSVNQAFETWKQFAAFPQKQSGYVYVWVRLPWGIVPSGIFEKLADIVSQFGNGTLRTSNDQNFVIPWVRPESLPALYEALGVINMQEFGAGQFEDVVSCPGGFSCNLAITNSRNLGEWLAQYLKEKYSCEIQENQDLQGIHIKISGCPNACGQHRIGTIGLQGAFSLVEKKQMPVYQIYLGGQLGLDFAKFGALVGKVPAQRVPQFMDRLIEKYRNERDEKNFLQWIDSTDKDSIKAITKELSQVTLEDKHLFIQPGDDTDFAFTGFGEAECV